MYHLIISLLFGLLQLYTDYVKNFDHATTTLNQWMKRSPKFASIIEELQVSGRHILANASLEVLCGFCHPDSQCSIRSEV